MDEFGTIRLHKRTIRRYRKFSKRITKSYSETLESIMDFFEWHGVSPSNRFANQINKEEQTTRKRVEAIIAIIKSIEKTQTLPTTVMMQALFGKHEVVKKSKIPVLVESGQQKMTKNEWDKLNNSISKVKYDWLKEGYKKDGEIFEEVLKKIKWTVPRFGKPFYKIDINSNELGVLKNRFRNRN